MVYNTHIEFRIVFCRKPIGCSANPIRENVMVVKERRFFQDLSCKGKVGKSGLFLGEGARQKYIDRTLVKGANSRTSQIKCSW